MGPDNFNDIIDRYGIPSNSNRANLALKDRHPVGTAQIAKTIATAYLGLQLLTGCAYGLGPEPTRAPVVAVPVVATGVPSPTEVSPVPTVILQPVAMSQPTETSIPQEGLAQPITITEKMLTEGLTGIGGGEGDGIISAPTATVPNPQETPSITEKSMLEYSRVLWNKKATDEYESSLTKDPIAALQYKLSPIEYFAQSGNVEVPFMQIPVLLNRSTLVVLPDKAPLYEFKDFSTNNLTINKGTHLIIIGVSQDGQKVVFAFDDYTRTPDSSSPRMFFGTSSSTEINTLLSLNDSSLRTDENGVTSVVQNDQGIETTLVVNTIEPSLVNKIVMAAGAAFVNEISAGKSHPNPVVPYPPRGLIDTSVRIEQYKLETANGVQTLYATAGDSQQSKLATATFNEKTNTWEWRKYEAPRVSSWWESEDLTVREEGINKWLTRIEPNIEGFSPEEKKELMKRILLLKYVKDDHQLPDWYTAPKPDLLLGQDLVKNNLLPDHPLRFLETVVKIINNRGNGSWGGNEECSIKLQFSNVDGGIQLNDDAKYWIALEHIMKEAHVTAWGAWNGKDYNKNRKYMDEHATIYTGITALMDLYEARTSSGQYLISNSETRGQVKKYYDYYYDTFIKGYKRTS